MGIIPNWLIKWAKFKRRPAIYVLALVQCPSKAKLFQEANIQVQNDHGVPHKLASCIDMRLAGGVLHGNFGPVYLLQVSKNNDKKHCFLKTFGIIGPDMFFAGPNFLGHTNN